MNNIVELRLKLNELLSDVLNQNAAAYDIADSLEHMIELVNEIESDSEPDKESNDD
jgi:hypothetical protein